MSWDDFGDLSAAGSSRSPGRRAEISRRETQSQIQRTLRPFGPTTLLHLHPAKGAKCYLFFSLYFTGPILYIIQEFEGI